MTQFPELEIALRSRDPTPSASTSVYIADSMVRTLAWVSLASSRINLTSDVLGRVRRSSSSPPSRPCLSEVSRPVALVSLECVVGDNRRADACAARMSPGTFASRGGHNPIEPLRAGWYVTRLTRFEGCSCSCSRFGVTNGRARIGSCRVFVGPNMHNFEDIVEQINGTHARTWTNSPHAPSSDGVVTLPPTPSAGLPAICSVKDATELALALSEHFRVHASPPRVPEHQELMRTLAVQSLQSHERKLLEWLAAHASK